MKFSEMTYTCPDLAAAKQQLSALTAELAPPRAARKRRRGVPFLQQER